MQQPLTGDPSGRFHTATNARCRPLIFTMTCANGNRLSGRTERRLKSDKDRHENSHKKLFFRLN